MDWAVILIRSPSLNDRIWIDPYRRAMARAEALTFLHSCNATFDHENRVIKVQAGGYYDSKTQ